jgi:acetyl esterase/lipase
MLHIEAPVPTAVVMVGSVEESYLASSRAFVERLGRAGVSAELIVAEQQDHRDTVLSLGDARSRLFREILAMVRPAG